MSFGLTEDGATLVQAMAWYHQATSHCVDQCWRRSLSPYGVTRPPWVKPLLKVVYITDEYYIPLQTTTTTTTKEQKQTKNNRGYTVTSHDSEFQKPHGGAVPLSWSVNEGSLLPAVATQLPGQFALHSTATRGGASTLTYNQVQLTTCDGAPWRTDISLALDGGSFEHLKTSVRPLPLLAPSACLDLHHSQATILNPFNKFPGNSDKTFLKHVQEIS